MQQPHERAQSWHSNAFEAGTRSDCELDPLRVFIGAAGRAPRRRREAVLTTGGMWASAQDQGASADAGRRGVTLGLPPVVRARPYLSLPGSGLAHPCSPILPVPPKSPSQPTQHCGLTAPACQVLEGALTCSGAAHLLLGPLGAHPGGHAHLGSQSLLPTLLPRHTSALVRLGNAVQVSWEGWAPGVLERHAGVLCPPGPAPGLAWPL